MTAMTQVMTDEIAKQIIWAGPPEGWSEEPVDSKLVDTSRWHNWYVDVYEHYPTSTFWAIRHGVGATEGQELDEYDINWFQVVKTTKVVEVYTKV